MAVERDMRFDPDTRASLLERAAAGAPTGAPRPMEPKWRPIVVGLLVVAALTGCGDDTSGEAPRPAATATLAPLGSAPTGTREASPSPPTTPATLGSLPDEHTADEHIAIEPGAYRVPSSAWSVVDFMVTIPDGWAVQYGHVFSKHEDEEDEFGFYAVVVDEIYTDSCQGEEVPLELGPGVDDLVAALVAQSGPAVSGPVDTTLGGYPAVRVDLEIPDDLDVETCRLEGNGLQIWYSEPADKYFVLLPDAIASVYILDVIGERQVFLTQQREATSDEDLAELQAVLQSIRVGS